MMYFALLAIGLALAADPVPAPAKADSVRRAECLASPSCAHGWCSPAPLGHPTKCIPRSDADCQISNECKLEGHCEYDKKSLSCALRKPATCGKSLACLHQGLCQAGDNGYGLQCWAQTPEQCRASLQCQTWGRCTHVEYGCEPYSTDDCKASWICRNIGRCESQKTPLFYLACAATSEGCRASEECKSIGRCTYSEADDDCVVARGDCAQTQGCKDFGWCGVLPRYDLSPPCTELGCFECAANRCDNSEPCRKWGACTLVNGLCRVSEPITEPTCVASIVKGVVASATSSRANDAFGVYAPAAMVDRDARTFWAPASTRGGEILTFKLPEPMRVTRIWLRNGTPSSRVDVPFGVVALGVVRAGSASEVFYRHRWITMKGEGYPTDLPPTLTDTVTFEILAVHSNWGAEPILAIPEVLIEACPAEAGKQP